MTASSGWMTSSHPQNLKNLPNRPPMVPQPPLVRSLRPLSTSNRFLLYSSSRYCKPLCYNSSSSSSSSSSSRHRVWAVSSWPWDNLRSRRMWRWLPLPVSLRRSCCRTRPPSCRGETAVLCWAWHQLHLLSVRAGCCAPVAWVCWASYVCVQASNTRCLCLLSVSHQLPMCAGHLAPVSACWASCTSCLCTKHHA